MEKSKYELDLRDEKLNEIIVYLDNYFNLLEFLNGIIITK